MWKRNIGILLLICASILAARVSVLWAATPMQNPLPLLQLQREMLDNNKGLKALEQKVAALTEEVRAAGALDDPRLGFGLLNLPADSFRFDEQPMTQKQITLAQRIPWFGKRDLKTQRAALNALRLESVLESKKLELIRNLKDAYYELGFVAASLEINARLTTLIDKIVQVAETRYAFGKGLQQDILQAQVEQSRLMDRHNLLKRQRRALEDRINGLLNRNAYVRVEAPKMAGLPDLPGSIEMWQATASKSNPDLQTKRIEIEQAKVDIDLAGKAYYPDPDLKFAYGQRDADTLGDERADFLSATITFSLPVWAKRKQDRRHEAAAKRREAAKAQFDDVAARLPHEVDAVVAELEQIKQNYDLYTEALLVQANQWAESARFSYEVGKVNFNTMVSAQLQELKLERQAQQYLYQFYRKMAVLDNLLGGRLHEDTPKQNNSDMDNGPASVQNESK